MIPLFKVFMSEDVLKPLNEVLMSGYITQGKQVEKYETALKEFLGNPFLLTLNSATAGLTLALRLLKNKDETSKCLVQNSIKAIVVTTFHEGIGFRVWGPMLLFKELFS